MDERGRSTMFGPLDPVRDPNPCAYSHVAEDIKLKTNGEAPSIYHVYWHGWLVKLRLTRLCLPQHLFFLLGILLYATGTVFLPVNSRYWFIGIVGGSLCVLFVLGRLPPATEV